MRQVTQNYKTGELSVVAVPSPAIRPGGVIVRNAASLISAGTEKTKVDTAKMTLLGKARSRPDQVKKVLETLKKEGYANTYRKVMGKLDSLSPLGYSSAGIVSEVGAGVTEFRVGDRVACAGAGYANHSEAVFVPKNLCAKIPAGVSFEEACFGTVGAIALQGVRQADVRLGETVAVIGLGLIGQITLQLLRASGCRVIGIDIDPVSVDVAKRCGAEFAAVSGRDDVTGLTRQLSGGLGVDAVIITAGTKSNATIEQAPRLLRDRGRVVVVGAVKMDVPREPYFQKEIELRLSRSYGPGRYDVAYEEKGHDYPIGYVRWTEKRNLEEFLNQIASGRIDLKALISHRFKLEEAQNAYELIAGEKSERYVGIVMEYDPERPLERVIPLASGKNQLPTKGQLGIGMIGAGSFAKSTILPRLKSLGATQLTGIHTATGLTATDVGGKYGFAFAASSPEEILAHPDTDAVFITTRHNTHAPLTLAALRLGKAVFVEKPLAINEDELREIVEVMAEGNGRVLVGFNRRFAPMTAEVKRFFAKQPRPRAIQIRVNAGEIPADHWIQDPEEGGGRIIGEVCHFIDLAQFLADSAITHVVANALYDTSSSQVVEDVVTVTLTHSNGSLSTINYFANGDTSYPKERIEIYAGGDLAIIDDFTQSTLVRGGKAVVKKVANQDKGHSLEIESFVDALRKGASMPIPLNELINSSLATLKAVEALRSGTRVVVGGL